MIMRVSAGTAAAAKRLWDRWQITIVLVAIVAVTFYAHAVDARHNDDVCTAVSQVRAGALHLTSPTPTVGVTDPAMLARIEASNEAKARAARDLRKDLACR